MSQNPFATPKVQETHDPSADPDTDDARIRNEHLKHEANIQAIGSLWILGGGLAVLVGGPATFGGAGLGEAVLLLLFGLFLLWVGVQTRRLMPSIRIPATILSAIGLIGIPIGTLISGYMLYLIHSEKGRMVLSERYQGIRARTPHIKYRTSPVVIVLGVLLLVFLVAGLVLPTFMR